MNLKNGYKVMYEVIEDTERVFLASTTGIFADAEEIARFTIGEYKVVYQRGNKFFGIDAEGVETRLDAFDKVFVEIVEEDEGTTITEVDEPELPETELDKEIEETSNEEVPEIDPEIEE